MNTISINGMNINARGSIVVSNGKVIVNGIDVTPDAKEINIVINGDTDKIQVDACNSFQMTGNAGSIKTMSGDVEISGDITESVSTMSGDVDCGNIGGSVSTMSGDIKQRKS
jgi:hypothetical protein